jgi:HlyD family secretion protein
MGAVRRVPLAALVAVCSLLALGAASCTGGVTGIGIGAAQRGDVAEVVDASASVTARAVARLSAPSAGTIARLTVAPGGTVRAGQVIAVISSPEAQRQLRQARDALSALSSGGFSVPAGTDLVAVQKRTDTAAAKAFASARSAATAIADPVLRTTLLAQIDAAAQQYASVAATARSLATAVRSGIASLSRALGALGAAQRVQAQSAYQLAKAAVDALTLRAPIGGVVQYGGAAGPAASGGSLADLLGAAGGAAPGGAAAAPAAGSGGPVSGPGVDDAVSVGSQVGPGTSVVTIVDVSTLGLVADVDETDVLLVAPGVTARVELDAAPGASYDATVGSVDLLPTTSARGGVAYRARLSLRAGQYADGRPAPTPRPGMSAVAHLQVRQARGVVTVPAEAIFTAGGRDAVWVVQSGHAVQVPVTVGVQGQDQVEIVSGVSAGDRVVVRGADKVHSGQSLP